MIRRAITRARTAIDYVLLIPFGPLVIAQGVRVRRDAVRLPPADGPTGHVGQGSPQRRVVVIGDSVAAGVGVGHHAETIAGQTCALLVAHHGGRADWTVLAMSGLAAGDIIGLIDPPAMAEADLVIVSVGVNDTKNLHSLRRFERELSRLLDRVAAAAPAAQVCVLELPSMQSLPALPWPLSRVLGIRGRQLARSAATVLQQHERVRAIAMTPDARGESFAADGFHPSMQLHARIADAIISAVGSGLPRQHR